MLIKSKGITKKLKLNCSLSHAAFFRKKRYFWILGFSKWCPIFPPFKGNIDVISSESILREWRVHNFYLINERWGDILDFLAKKIIIFHKFCHNIVDLCCKGNEGNFHNSTHFKIEKRRYLLYYCKSYMPLLFKLGFREIASTLPLS